MTTRLELRHASRTDRGLVREGNEDSLFAGARVLAVADGMGGHVAGEVASREVISEVQQLDLTDFASRPAEALVDAMEVANGRLRGRVSEDASLEGMGTTLSAMMLSEDRLALVHVGDSRVYRFVDGRLTQLTNDDTLVQQLVDEGRITSDEARVHPQRSLLTQALDGRRVEPQVMVFPALPGERYLLCTDGLSGVVPADVVVAALELSDPADAVDVLVDAALERGAPDNVSVIVADVVAVPDDTPAAQSPLAGAVAGAGALAAASSGGAEVGTRPLGGTADLLVVPDPANAPLADIGVPGAAVAPESSGTSPDAETGEDSDEDEAPARRRRVPRWVIVLVALLAVIVVGLALFWAWLGHQWYVGVASGSSGDQVAIYQGVPASIGPVDLSTLETETGIAVDDLNAAARARVTDTIPANSLEEAEQIVTEIQTNGLLPVCTDVVDAPTEPVPGENCRAPQEVSQ